MMERESIPSGYISPGNSPFLKKFPREIRDKIYDELLIVQRSPRDQDKYEKIQAGLATGEHEYEYERELDYLNQDYLLILDSSGANKGMLFIGQNKGILLANKQIYDEATTTLFGKNIFAAIPQAERIQAFWRCGIGSTCIPHHRPCHVRPETFAKIKHLHILVSICQPDGALKYRGSVVRNLQPNLQTIVDTLLESGNKLSTLIVRYWSHFGGEYEAVRESLEGPLPRSMATRPPALIRNAMTGRFQQIHAHSMHSTIFRDIHMLDPLKALKGVADYVNIRGDLPCEYRDELRKILSTEEPRIAGRKLRKADIEAASKKPKPDGGLAAFAAEKLAEDPDMEPGMKTLYNELLNSSTMSPAVKSLLFPEDYGVDTMEPLSDHQQAATAVPEAVPIGSIGVLDGKVIFGPVRPPSLGNGA